MLQDKLQIYGRRQCRSIYGGRVIWDAVIVSGCIAGAYARGDIVEIAVNSWRGGIARLHHDLLAAVVAIGRTVGVIFGHLRLLAAAR